jgi:hypothetical protein
VLFGLGVVVYAWFATGVHAFSPLAYTFVAIPSSLALVAYGVLGGFSTDHALTDYYRTRAADASWTSTAGWIAIAVLAAVLEIIGLILGGRSPNVPTLSTTVDHLLVDHWGRGLLFIAWIVIGTSPLRRLYRLRRRTR